MHIFMHVTGQLEFVLTLARAPVQFERKERLINDMFLTFLFCFQEKVDDERSDKDETDESGEEEEEEGGKKDMKKNRPVQNGHTVHNNNHSKTE